MTIRSGDPIFATDFTTLVSKINSKITEANRNDANISRLEMDYSHPIGRNRKIHHENVNRIIDKYNELISSSKNMSGNSLLTLVTVGNIIQNDFNKFKTIVDNIDNILFEAAIGSLQIKGPSEINENRSERYIVDKAVEGGTGWEQVSTGINWSISGTGGSYASVSTSGFLKTESVPLNQNITLHANHTDSYGTHSTSKDITIKRIPEIIGLEIQSIDGSGQNINEGDKHRYKCTVILDEQGGTQLLAGGFNWISSNTTKLLIGEIFDDPDYPGIKIAEITTININQETESVQLRASYKGKTGQLPLIVANSAAIVSIYIEEKNENAEIRTIEGEAQTLNAYGFTSDNSRNERLLNQDDLTWEIVQNNNTGSYFENNQFIPGTMISGDTPVIIKCTYRKGTSEQKYVTREVIIQKNAEVIAIAIYRRGSSDDPLSSLNVLEDSKIQLGCTIYFSDNTSDTNPDPRFVSWSFDNVSDAVLSGSGIGSSTGLLETGEISQDLPLQLRVSYRGFDGTREIIVRNINSVMIGDIDGNVNTDITVDEGTTVSFRLFALHNAGKTIVSGNLTWEFWKDNSSYNPPFASVNRQIGDVSANNRVNKDEITQLKCTWVTARTERMYTAYKAVRFHDVNYPISLDINSPDILYEEQSIFLTAKATLDNGDEITVDKNDTAMNWSITNYNGISSNLLSINSEGMLTLGDVDFNTKTISVRGTYAKNGSSRSKTVTVELQGIYIESLEIYGLNMNRMGAGQSITLKCREVYNYGPPRDTIDGLIWSIDGDRKGCTINSSTGLLTAGTQTGSITIKVYKNGIFGQITITLIETLMFSIKDGPNGSCVYSNGEYIFSGRSRISSNFISYNDVYIEICAYNCSRDIIVGISKVDNPPSYLTSNQYLQVAIGSSLATTRQTADFLGISIKDHNVKLCRNGLWEDTQVTITSGYSIELFQMGLMESGRAFIKNTDFKVNTPDKIYIKDAMNRYVSEETIILRMEVEGSRRLSDSLNRFIPKTAPFIKAGWTEDQLEHGPMTDLVDMTVSKIRLKNTNDNKEIYFKLSDNHYYTPRPRDFLPDQNYYEDNNEWWNNDHIPTPFPVTYEILINGQRPSSVRYLFDRYIYNFPTGGAWWFQWNEYNFHWRVPFINEVNSVRNEEVPFTIPGISGSNNPMLCRSIHSVESINWGSIIGKTLNAEFVFKLKDYDNHIVRQKVDLVF